jgi:predicted nucleotide-binding protein
MTPRVIGEFLRTYDRAPLPREDIARNVLVEMGVPPDRAPTVLEMILDGADSAGFLKSIKDKRYVDLSGAETGTPVVTTQQTETIIVQTDAKPDRSAPTQDVHNTQTSTSRATLVGDQISGRVFIAHGKNRQFLDPIKKLLGFGGMQALVSVERPSVSQPLPDKVFSEMRSCGAAIIHVDIEHNLHDTEGKEQAVLNPNVLIEIGAAIALYGRRFILLVRDGIRLPSDLQGLFEVRYKGDVLDSDATIRLLEAITDIKNHAIPDRYPTG